MKLSKHVLEISKNKYESNPNCEICKVLDEQFNNLKSFSDQEGIKRLELLLVNGYHLNNILESNNLKTKYKLLGQYLSYNDDIYKKALHKIGEESVVYNTYNAMSPTLIFGRWCKNCGSRKHDIYDTKFQSDLSSNLNYNLDTKTLSWKDIKFDFDHYFKIYKKSDISDFELLAETKSLELYDNDLDDGRIYTYMIQYIGLLDEVLMIDCIDVYIPVLDHTPKDINFEYRIHRYLENNDNDFKIIDYLYAKYEINDDNFGKVIFKVNHDHVPSISYWHEDLYFDKDNRFFFPDERQYFLKPYICSKKFKQDKDNDHKDYPDKYFWNKNSDVKIIQYKPFYKDYIYNLKFEPGKRKMHISFNLQWPNNIKELKLYFKQDDKYITDVDDTYKIITFEPYNSVEEYVIDIENLASNSSWVFAIFPTYDSCDEDIRIEYQNISLIGPYYEDEKFYKLPSDFYDINLWHLHKDFYRYDLFNKEEIRFQFNRDTVWVCDHLNYHDVGVLLIHENDIPECFTLKYDYKFLAKTSKDRLNMFYDFKLGHKVKNSSSNWYHFEQTYINQDYVLIRWEVMKHSKIDWTCAFLDNISIKAHKIIDKHTNNFTYDEKLIIKNEYSYNKKIRHDGKHKYAPERYYYMNVKINPYEKGDLEENFDKKAGET